MKAVELYEEDGKIYRRECRPDGCISFIPMNGSVVNAQDARPTRKPRCAYTRKAVTLDVINQAVALYVSGANPKQIAGVLGRTPQSTGQILLGARKSGLLNVYHDARGFKVAQKFARLQGRPEPVFEARNK
jgi:hypothetical protein